MSDYCTCKISKTPCNSAFIFKDGKSICEVNIELVGRLKNGFAFLCAGAALQKLNRDIKEAKAS
jgi:hypothetical protein